MGDYLATRGWYHYDGDGGIYEGASEAYTKAMEKFWVAMQRICKGGAEATDDEW